MQVGEKRLKLLKKLQIDQFSDHFIYIYFNAILNNTLNHVKVSNSMRRVVILMAEEDYCSIYICLYNSQAYQ